MPTKRRTARPKSKSRPAARKPAPKRKVANPTLTRYFPVKIPAALSDAGWEIKRSVESGPAAYGGWGKTTRYHAIMRGKWLYDRKTLSAVKDDIASHGPIRNPSRSKVARPAMRR